MDPCDLSARHAAVPGSGPRLPRAIESRGGWQTAFAAWRRTADREPGGKLAGRIGAWGYRSGGVAVLELARQAEARGQPLAGVAAAFVVETGVPVPMLITPTLVIEGAPDPELGDRALV